MNKLVGANKEMIIAECNNCLDNPKGLFDQSIYGGGQASKVIVESLIASLGE